MKKQNIILIGIGAALATVATIFLVRRKKVASGEKPPRKAPQLNIENPGTQSDFPVSPSASELG